MVIRPKQNRIIDLPLDYPWGDQASGLVVDVGGGVGSFFQQQPIDT